MLGLGPHQVLSVELQSWVAETGAELPFQQAAEQLERLSGIGLGVETVRTHSEQVGTALAELQRAAAATVAETQESAEPVEVAPELLVAEGDGVQVRFQDGWHEAKVGEIAGCWACKTRCWSVCWTLTRPDFHRQVGTSFPNALPRVLPAQLGRQCMVPSGRRLSFHNGLVAPE